LISDRTALDEREEAHRRLGFQRLISGEGGLGLIGSDAPVVTGNRKKVQGVRLDQARSKAWSVASVFSRNGDEGRLGMLRAAVIFGFGRGNRISAGKDQVYA
jgi:hypothetical protein